MPDNMWTKPGLRRFASPLSGKEIKNPGDKRLEDVTAYRRENVARLLDEGLSTIQIWRTMADEKSEYYTENPHTGKPYGRSTIQKDEKALLDVTQAAAIKSARLKKVKSLRRRGLTDTEIWMLMSTKPEKGKRNGSYTENPHTGKPYSLRTIQDDLVALRLAAYTMAQESADSWRAKLLMELEEVKLAGWAEKQYGIVIRAIEQQMKMVGAEKPREQINHNIKYDASAKDLLRDKIGNMMGDVLDAIADDADFIDVEIKDLSDGGDAADDSA